MLARLIRFLLQRSTTNSVCSSSAGCRLALEGLENRLTPTATFGFYDATSLVINGDDGDDNILITEGAVAGTFAVLGGGIDQTFTGLTNIYINLNGGADQSVTFNGSVGGSLAGILGISDGSTNSFSLTISDNANVLGGLVFAATADGDVTINLGAAGAGTTTMGDVALYGGTGAATVNIDDITMGFLSANFNAAADQTLNIGVNAPVSMGFLSMLNSSTAAGSNTVVTVGTGGNVTINGNAAIVAGLEGSLTMSSTGVQGFLSFNAFAATAAADVTIINTTIATFLSLWTGAGDDTINVAAAAGTVVNVGGNLGIASQGGADTLNLYGVGVSGNTIIDTGDDDDVLDLDFNNDDGVHTTFNGAANIQLGPGDDSVYYAFDSGDTGDAAVFIKGGVLNGGPALNDDSNFKTTSDAVSPVPITEINFDIIVS